MEEKKYLDFEGLKYYHRGLMSLVDDKFTGVVENINGLDARLDAIEETGGEQNVLSDWNLTDNTSDDYIKNKPDLSIYAEASDLSTVATSGSYEDLTNKPTIPVIPTNVSAFTNDVGYITASDIAEKADISSLATVATSGSYNDLTNKPTIPTIPTNVSEFNNDAGYLTQHLDISGKANISDLSSVATSGDYNDLVNKPTLFSGNYNDLTNKPDLSNYAQNTDLEEISLTIENNELTTAAVLNDLNDKIENKLDELVSGTTIKTINNQSILGSGNIEITSGGGVQVQPDWNETDSSSLAYILNKPNIPTATSDLTNDSGFLTSYTETDPTIPTHVKNITTTDISNWNAKLDSAPVTSVNGLTGAVTIDVGVTSFNGSTGAVTYTAPVTSVNGQTGVVTIKANVQSDWNATTGDAVILNKPDLTTYENKVTSVNGETGDVEIPVQKTVILNESEMEPTYFSLEIEGEPDADNQTVISTLVKNGHLIFNNNCYNLLDIQEKEGLTDYIIGNLDSTNKILNIIKLPYLSRSDSWWPFSTSTIDLNGGVTSVNGQTGAVSLALGDTNVIETIKLNGITQTVTNKTVDLTIQGGSGLDGFSPTATVSKSGDVATISITDKNGTTTATISDGQTGPQGPQGQQGDTGPQGPLGETGPTGPSGRGISSITKTSTSGLVDTYTITYTDSTTSTFTLTNGAEGAAGSQGEKGEKGDKGDTGDTGATGPRGTSIYKIYTAPTSSSGQINGVSYRYRIPLNTVLSEALISEVNAGDIIEYSTWHYGVLGIDLQYVYLSNYTNIKGATGETGPAGTNGTNANWLTGTILTGTGSSITTTLITSNDVSVNDMYLNVNTGTIYRCTAATSSNSTWLYLSTLNLPYLTPHVNEVDDDFEVYTGNVGIIKVEKDQNDIYDINIGSELDTKVYITAEHIIELDSDTNITNDLSLLANLTFNNGTINRSLTLTRTSGNDVYTIYDSSMNFDLSHIKKISLNPTDFTYLNGVNYLESYLQLNKVYILDWGTSEWLRIQEGPIAIVPPSNAQSGDELQIIMDPGNRLWKANASSYSSEFNDFGTQDGYYSTTGVIYLKFIYLNSSGWNVSAINYT